MEFILQRLVLRSVAAGRLLRGSVFPTISGALDSQIEALQQHHSSRGGLFEPSSGPVTAARRAAVESLPATVLTKETAGAGQHTTCPICLHVSAIASFSSELVMYSANVPLIS